MHALWRYAFEDYAVALSDRRGGTPAFDLGCVCSGCCADRLSLPQYFVPPTSGVAANGLPILSWDGAAAQLTRESGGWGEGATITYAFRSTSPATMPDGTSGFQRFSAAQIAAAEEALALWAEVANIDFVRVGAGSTGEGAYSNAATILFGNYSSGAEGASAFAFYPGSTSASSSAGDIWVNISLPDNATLEFGGFGPHTLAHEIGHAIGIAHPGPYNAGAGANPTYENDAVYWQDARMFSIMSYFGSINTGGSLPAFSGGPQFHDIAAAQALYGVNTTTRIGDTTYGFNANTGHAHTTIVSAFDFAVFAIWDAGGVDTLDLSGYETPSEIDLRAESFSSAGPNAVAGGVSVGNISIARSVVIENAIGGSGDDLIIGNGVANLLVGNGGADELTGGAGADTASYAGSAARVVVNLNTGSGRGGDAEGDTLAQIENLSGSGRNDILIGDAGVNVLRGGGGADAMNGLGGNDTLLGAAGADAFVFSTQIGAGNVDRIAGFVVADDTIRLDDAIFAGLALGVLSANAFVAGAAAAAADDRIIYNPANGALMFDADGNGAGARVRIAVLDVGLALTAADIVVI